MSSADNEILDEKIFAWVLNLERQRTDRSRRPFLLLLLELTPPLRNNQLPKSRMLVKHITQSLKNSTRQTDIIGWYKNNVAIGVIFTELHRQNPAFHKIQHKTVAGLQARLTPEQTQTFNVSFHPYPPQNLESPCSSPKSERLYPDLKQKKMKYFSKRLIDILGSLSLIFLFSPVFIIVSMLIKLTSKGPILFRQTRIGQFGQPFMFLKFRSMYTDADSKVHEKYVTDFILMSKHGDSEADALKQDGLYKMREDPRITPFGHFLRKMSLDELPQLFNVLVGRMSLVGPRPPLPYEVEHYDTWHMRRVWEAKPGITGLWQVQGRSRTVFDDMVRLDLQYVDEWSIWTDIKILLQTPWAVLSCKGAR